MPVRKRSIAGKAGLPPESLVHVGRDYGRDTRVTVLDYDAAGARERAAGDVAVLAAPRAANAVTWISVDGLHNVGLIEKIGAAFAIHPLVLEDILNTHQRPKQEDYGDYLYIVFQAFVLEQDGTMAGEQVSMIVGDGYVLSFQESGRELFKAVRERINSGKGRIRREGADYLAYSLIDTIVDNYFVVLEDLGERLEDLEDTLVTRPGQGTLQDIHYLKREMLFFRKALWPLREVIGALSRGESPLIRQTTLPYVRDAYDHTVQVIDTLETYRDILSGMLDIYLSSVSYRLNEVMKLLTIISTIFIPLTFLAGVYGMNFRYMPELEWEYGYPAVWAVMILAGLVMVRYFRRRGWL
ncbi:magnesium/cobalt transporter CorA [Anaeroselena agilis]|uniref:Magnesium transport protein CorA n=1 Tax=Anaeroselena agilis TaxID=3063788 RepID=A0ABU3P3R4_9FIRM|nr:magnesium/cobalt transporter CorA [Selenomonadales bacterium 4137-cl]